MINENLNNKEFVFKGFIIKYSKTDKDFYAVSNNSSKTFIGKSIKEIQIKILNHLENMKKAEKSPLNKITKELNKITEKDKDEYKRYISRNASYNK